MNRKRFAKILFFILCIAIIYGGFVSYKYLYPIVSHQVEDICYEQDGNGFETIKSDAMDIPKKIGKFFGGLYHNIKVSFGWEEKDDTKDIESNIQEDTIDTNYVDIDSSVVIVPNENSEDSTQNCELVTIQQVFSNMSFTTSDDRLIKIIGVSLNEENEDANIETLKSLLEGQTVYVVNEPLISDDGEYSYRYVFFEKPNLNTGMECTINRYLIDNGVGIYAPKFDTLLEKSIMD